ncbi:hypothetical protein QBC34DRAFT_486389 [Podospora aff. communis PSN243]|uniref:2-oxoadipate dioxygenase/decarboxylase n=1 Tax=Podospora aff. communis PSN243 TaxID=3040156 RepID=A0AAV9GIE6_9PEZI|nr:hypothetical protein QBC34DRAFT_486389 [Podospora aff. communis PSN243]
MSVGETPAPWGADHLRTRFVKALSDMYRAEVPLYDKLVDIVQAVDDSVLAAQGHSVADLPVRHRLERHGAIRLGTAEEMRMIGRLFGIMGMYPAGYYDLQIVGFPLHGTAFRPTSEESLGKNPFRVFTTVLRAHLISSDLVRKTASGILSTRTLFSPRLRNLMDRAEADRDSMTAEEADELIAEALKIFKWHSRSTVPLKTYLSLKNEHPMVADIVCFPSAHINHLTPRTLDIDAVQLEMIRRGLPAKECIEGPPSGRKCEILLRQTSFKALEEQVVFADDSGNLDGGEGCTVKGTHTARFGEVEQRGAAVTRKGRNLYDRLLASAVAIRNQNPETCNFDDVLAKAFSAYPDDWTTLRREGLVFFRYKVAPGASSASVTDDLLLSARSVSMEDLLERGLVQCEPITYEDFLPFSAAGIFTSNLGGSGGSSPTRGTPEAEEPLDGRRELEGLLGSAIPSEIDLYHDLQSASVGECEKVLGLEQIVLAH